MIVTYNFYTVILNSRQKMLVASYNKPQSLEGILKRIPHILKDMQVTAVHYRESVYNGEPKYTFEIIFTEG